MAKQDPLSNCPNRAGCAEFGCNGKCANRNDDTALLEAVLRDKLYVNETGDGKGQFYACRRGDDASKPGVIASPYGFAYDTPRAALRAAIGLNAPEPTTPTWEMKPDHEFRMTDELKTALISGEAQKNGLVSPGPRQGELIAVWNSLLLDFGKGLMVHENRNLPHPTDQSRGFPVAAARMNALRFIDPDGTITIQWPWDLPHPGSIGA